MDLDLELNIAVRYNCIYLIYLSTIGQKGEKVYKFGKTYRPKLRFRQYPRNSTILLLIRVIDSHHVEDEIYELFMKHFTQRIDYGREYFEADDVRTMINYINRLIDHMGQRMDDDMVRYVRNDYKNTINFRIHDEDNTPDDIGDQLVQYYEDNNNRPQGRMNYLERIEKMSVKKKLKSNEILSKKLLYEKEKKLTHGENLVVANIKNRAELLGLEFKKKVHKKKNERVLVDDSSFMKRYALLLLYKDDNELDNISIRDVQKKYNVSTVGSLIKKIRCIRILETKLGVTRLDIDTQRDEGKFSDKIEFDEVDRKSIIKLFRISKKNQESDNYKYWYYTLIHMYKNILGEKFFKTTRVQRNKIRYYDYVINNDILQKERQLINNNELET